MEREKMNLMLRMILASGNIVVEEVVLSDEVTKKGLFEVIDEFRQQLYDSNGEGMKFKYKHEEKFIAWSYSSIIGLKITNLKEIIEWIELREKK